MAGHTFAVSIDAVHVGTIARTLFKRPHSWLAKSVYFRAEALCASKREAQAWLEATYYVATKRWN